MFKKLWKKVKQFGRAVDPTYSKGFVGRITSPIAKPAVQSGAVVLTGGASLLFQSKAQKRSAIQGFIGGASIGAGALAGGLAAGVAGAKFAAGQYADSVRQPVGAVGNASTSDPSNPSQVEPLQAGIFGTPGGKMILIFGAIGLLAFALFGKRR